MVKLEINSHFAVGHFCRSKNKISVIVEEIVAGESEDKLLVPLPRLCNGLLPQCRPRCQLLTLWKREKLGVTGGRPFHVSCHGVPNEKRRLSVRLCEISAISFAFADLLRGSKGLKGAPSVPFDL